ncbi:hypothetical protein, partial [Actinocorallia lasiicapitis]
MGLDGFPAGTTYDNTYFLFVDACGYSRIVADNPRDLAGRAFDLLRGWLVDRSRELAARSGCARAELRSWHGDGGLLIVHDERESAARDVALQIGRALLDDGLPWLHSVLAPDGFRGEVRLRIAVHKGPLRLPGPAGEGAHSPDLNFAAHLERVTPANGMAISADVHRTAGPFADLFVPVGPFEGREVYLLGPAATTDWLAATAL